MNLENLKDFLDRWKRYILYTTLVATIIVIYGGHLLSPWQVPVLQAAVAAGFTLLMESIFRLSDRLSDRLDSIPYRSITDAIPKMAEILSGGWRLASKRRKIRILAGPGTTTVCQVLDQLLHDTSCPLEISVQIIDPGSPIKDHFPQTWEHEAGITLGWLKKRAAAYRQEGRDVVITCSTYQYCPCVRGILIDDDHLFLGMFFWEKLGNETRLSGAKEQHVYYVRKTAYEPEFHLFETWFEFAPHKLAFASTATEEPKAISEYTSPAVAPRTGSEEPENTDQCLPVARP